MAPLRKNEEGEVTRRWREQRLTELTAVRLELHYAGEGEVRRTHGEPGYTAV